jgi:hypothetical protein
MASYTFTVTQATYNFTATVSSPANLTLADYPDNVAITNVLTTVTVINNVQPITISGTGGQAFNQSLNTTDNVAFASVTTPKIYGAAQQPVYFPNGISLANVGTTFNGGVDMAGIINTFTNQLSLIFALLPVTFGTVRSPSYLSVNFGSV